MIRHYDQSIRVEQREADQNRHLVYLLEDEAVLRSPHETERRNKWKREAHVEAATEARAEASGPAGSKAADITTGEEDISVILEWMMADKAHDNNNTGTSTTVKAATETATKKASGRRGRGERQEARRQKAQRRKKHNRAQHRARGIHQRRKNNEAGGEQQHVGAEQRGTTVPPVFSSWTRMRSTTAGTAWPSTSEAHLQFLPTPGQVIDADDVRQAESKARQSRDRTLHQKQYNAKQQQHSRRALWPIPFSYTFGSARSARGQTVRQFWLLNETIRFVDVGLERNQYLLANPHWVNWRRGGGNQILIAVFAKERT